MAQSTIRPTPAPSPHNRAPSARLSGKVEDAKKAVLLILQDTDWPNEASNDAQALMQTVEVPLDLDKLPQDEMQIPAEVSLVIKLLLRELESAHAKLKAESKKYGTKKKGFRKEIKKLFSRTDPSQCTEMLSSCRSDVEESTTALINLLSNLNIGSDQHALQLAEGEGEDDSPPSTQIQQMATTLDPNAGTVPITKPAQLPSFTSQVGQAVGGQAGKEESLNAANKAFKLAEGISGALPVVGSFVGAVAKVGLTVVEMAQVMNSNEETAERLGTHTYRLSSILEPLSNRAHQLEKSQIATGMEDLLRELRDIEQQLDELKSQPSMKKFWHSSDQAGSLRTLQDKTRAALEEIHLLVNLNTSLLVTELHDESKQNKRRDLLKCLGDGRYGARGNAIEDVTCLPGTRIKTLERIDNWIRGGLSSERVLWIRGMAGRGKSTIASTAAYN